MTQTRTTIRNIDPDILWETKIYAAQTRQTIGDVVNIALELLLDEEDETEEPIILDVDARRTHHVLPAP